MARSIEVLPYDPAWAQDYLDELAGISELLGGNLVAAHHIGSTAVPGLVAKPTIDILFEVCGLGALDACAEGFRALRYAVKGEHGLPGRRYYQKLAGERHLVHIHAYEIGHKAIQQHLDFRDYLIAHPQTARQYAALKHELAARHRDVPEQYTQGKDAFIHGIIIQAADWRVGVASHAGQNQ